MDGGVSGLADAFTDALILGGVEGSSVWADVAPFMELLNNADYQNNVYQVSVAVVKNAYDTIDDLNRAVAAAVNAQGGSGTGSGGTGSSGTGGGTGGGIFGAVSQQELSALAPEQPEGTGERLLFRDVPEGHWAFDSVHYLYWQEIVSGDDNGFFEPDRQVTRAEMLKMLCNAFGLAEENRASFSDVPATAWYYGYAGAAAAAGLVNGYDGNLSPDAYLTREDMAVLVYRFAAYAGVELAAASPSFTDAAEISDYALDAVGALSGAGLISGMGDGTFAPQAGSTRAQVAAILYRFITTEAKGVGA